MLQLGRFDRVRLGHWPTPLERAPRLTAALGGPTIWIKRDDCTGLATGGNKTRKLEFLVGEAVARGADTLITLGAVQSNHVRQTAAAAARMGMACEILLERRLSQTTPTYERNGNVLFDRLLGARLREVPSGTDMLAAAEAVAGECRAAGRRPYVIPGGGSNEVGSLGYVACALETLAQAADIGFRIDTVVHATGSTGTQAGLLAGFEGAQSGVDVLGISVRQTRERQEAAVDALTQRVARHLGLAHPIGRDRVRANGDYVGEGYGVPTPGMIEALRLTARTEGVLLDPVYSGKAMAGLIDLCRKGAFGAGQNVVFVHTGGQAALSAYEEALSPES